MELLADIEKQAEEASSGFRLSLENTLQVGFNILRKAPAEFILYSIPGIVVFSNPVTALLLGGPVLASYLHMAHLVSRGQRIELSDFFEGFKKTRSFLKLNLLIALLVLVGLIMLVLPGIYLAVSYIFSHFFVWFYDKDPFEATRMSRKVVSGNFGQILLLLLILAGINVLGILALGIGMLLTMPFSFCVVYAAFDDIIGISN